jgi:hypothetical protein
MTATEEVHCPKLITFSGLSLLAKWFLVKIIINEEVTKFLPEFMGCQLRIVSKIIR